ncbi:nucleotide-diphospho-sugar transferase [uncultured Microscilla sp.]|uniref:nucleotide-diphospho-sugar transferase n=1 Tax=uncultured Microscilla sp. TaxID=432653 RepID=UPI002634253E|nr:nucleotide-diphospho-sugar transferase [uncultured Microscilla sp.]
MLDTPILFLVFNRPDTTRQVFERIQQIRPRQLFVAADGARQHKEGEQQKVDAVRKTITDNIDWDCEVKTLFREQNLGCGKAVSEGITWFFEQVEQGIILEDDTLPDLSFFHFCEELLDYYKDNERVMHIGGSNFLNSKIELKTSYYGSNYSQIWGWATWKNAWNKYRFRHDLTIQKITEIIKHHHFSKKEQIYWKKIYETYKSVDTWDYQWFFTIWIHQGISLISTKNLVKNVGFGEDATHTTNVQGVIERLQIDTQSIEKVAHLDKTEVNRKADMITFQTYFSEPVSLNRKLCIFLSNIRQKLKS